MSVNHCARSGGIIGIYDRFFVYMKEWCVFYFELLHRGDSNEYTQFTFFIIKKKITLNFPKCAELEFF